jgi:hypothetical protein
MISNAMSFGLSFAMNAGAVLSSLVSRIFITLDAVLNGHYVLASTWTITGNFELEFDVSTTSTAVQGVLNGSDAANDFVRVEATTGLIRLAAGGLTALDSTVAVNDGKLNHVRIVAGASGAEIFINGVSDVTDAQDWTSLDVDAIGLVNAAAFFDGVIANVKLTDLDTPANSLTFALDEVTANAETAAEGGNSVTYTNIPTGEPDRELFTLVGDDWIGQETITNGGFDTDTDWVKATGWTIGSGVASCDGTQVGSTNISQNGVTELGFLYRVMYTVTIYTAGTIRMLLGNILSATTPQSSAGTFSEVTTPDTATNVQVRGDVDFIGSVDNVSVKRILEQP